MRTSGRWYGGRRTTDGTSKQEVYCPKIHSAACSVQCAVCSVQQCRSGKYRAPSTRTLEAPTSQRAPVHYHSPLVTHHSPLTTRYSPLDTHYSLLTTRPSLPTTHPPLTHYLLLTWSSLHERNGQVCGEEEGDGDGDGEQRGRGRGSSLTDMVLEAFGLRYATHNTVHDAPFTGSHCGNA